MTRIGRSDLEIAPLILGGNVFGWTADRATSYAILDAFVESGGNAIDLADSYPHWAPGCSGGESEEIVGAWMADRGNRDDIVLCTKVGKSPGNLGVSRSQVMAGIEGSLRRLQTDRVDLYYCHADDPNTPLEETLSALGELVNGGTVRTIGASNYSAERLGQALRVSDELGVARFCAVQPQYSLLWRHEYEGAEQQLCAREGLSCLPYWGLAAGFLTGKYASADAAATSSRMDAVSRYMTPRNDEILEVVRAIAARHDVEPATIALAWLRHQPTVAAPIASVSRPGQLPALMASISLELTEGDVAALDAVSAT